MDGVKRKQKCSNKTKPSSAHCAPRDRTAQASKRKMPQRASGHATSKLQLYCNSARGLESINIYGLYGCPYRLSSTSGSMFWHHSMGPTLDLGWPISFRWRIYICALISHQKVKLKKESINDQTVRNIDKKHRDLQTLYLIGELFFFFLSVDRICRTVFFDNNSFWVRTFNLRGFTITVGRSVGIHSNWKSSPA